MKNLIIFALLGLVLLLSVQVSAAEKTCADNPLLPFLKQFINAQNEFVDQEEQMEYHTESYSEEPTEMDVYDPSEYFGGGDDYYMDGEGIDGEWHSDWHYYDYDGEYQEGEWHSDLHNKDYYDYFEDGELHSDLYYHDGEGEYHEYSDYIDYFGFLDGEHDGESQYDYDGEYSDDLYDDMHSEIVSEYEGGSERPLRPTKTRPSRPKNQVPKNEKQQARFENKQQQRRQKKEIKKYLQQEILKQKFSLEDIIAIENNTPSVVNGLSMCKSLNGQESCCNEAHIHKFKKLTKGYYLKKIKEQPKASEIYDLIEEYSWQLSTDECDIEDLIYEIEENEAVIAAFEKQRSCQRKAVFITNNLIRGTICQVCMSPSNYETYFAGEGENLQMKIHPNDMQKYREQMNEQIQCAEEAFYQYKEAAKSVVENLLNNQSCGSDILQQILEIAGIEEIVDEAEFPTCTVEPGFFDDGCLSEFEAQEEIQDDDSGLRRILAGSGGYLEDPSGISGAYEENPEEEAELQSLPDASTPYQVVQEEPQQENPNPAGSLNPIDQLLSGYSIGSSLMVIAGLLLQF